MWTKKRLWTTGVVSLACAMANAQTPPVAANSKYFQGWQMAKFVASVPRPVAGTSIAATLGGTPFTINSVGVAPRVYATWGGAQNGQLMYSPYLPTAIGLPTDPGNVWEFAGGEISIKFQAPMAVGTTLFSHDIDGPNVMEYRFYRCDGTQVDATSVDFLQIATANNPAQTPPVAGASDSFWRLASVANVNIDGATSGLVVNSADVCEIRTKELSTSGGNTVDFMLGIGPAKPSAVPVPVDSSWALLLASMGLIGLAIRRRQVLI